MTSRLEEILVVLCVLCVSLGNTQVLPGLMSSIEEDATLTTPGLVRKYGYPAEVHSVRTDDGYILEMHRIPYGVRSVAAPNKTPVFLQHGLLSCSASWVITGPDKGLAYILADQGYDVWMGNSRGNTYSRKHESYSTSGPAFWQFSWHEMGLYDIPAEIDYVLQKTGQQKLFYVGHSQGTTQFYVMASERPEYNAKVKAMISLSPIAFMNHMSNPFNQMLARINQPLELIVNMMGVYEFLPNTEMKTMMGQALCRNEAITQIMCENIIFLMVGYDSKQLNASLIPVTLGHAPAGASIRQLAHYAQEVNSGAFQQYDYHLFNLQHYGQFRPPNYDLSKITCPVALHYSDNDWLCHPKDVDRLYQRLGNPIGKFLVPFKEFNHLDFLWAIDARALVYDKVLAQLQVYA